MSGLWLALPLVLLPPAVDEPPLSAQTDRALVEVDDPAVLARIGARVVGPVVGGIAVVDLPAARRDALRRLPGVHETTCAADRCGSRLRPALDRSLPAARVPALREELGQAGTGAGAIVGVIDTGVDPTHPDLVRADGHARVAWIVDLGEAPRGVHAELEELVGAAVYGPEEIQAAVDASDPSLVGGADTVGHGTHIASIAAGGLGVAPDATLVVVKALRAGADDFDEADVVLATRFVLALADSLDLPAVVNLSLGGDDGGHDGSSLLERGLVASLEERAGRAIVAAAGNGAYADAHAVAVLSSRRPSERVRLSVPRPQHPEAPASVRLGAWTTGELQVTVEPPAEADPSAASVGAGAAEGEISIALADPAPGIWTLVLSGRGRADVWIAETDLVGPFGFGPRFSDHVDPGGQVMLPATAEEIIAVGSFATRTEWHDRDGDTHVTPTEREGDLSAFSARGPTRDGRAKPDLVAPGEAIVAALSRETDPVDPGSAFHSPGSADAALVDDDHAVLWGTSAATAHVSGVVALLFAADPTLETERVRSALCGAATPREERAWSVAHGWGALDAARTGDAISGRVAPADPDQALLSAVPDVPAPGDEVRILLALRGYAFAPTNIGTDAVTIRAVGQAGALPLWALGDGRFEASWTAPASKLGRTVAFEALLDGVVLPPVAVVEVAERRDDVGAGEHATVVGGGCSAVPLRDAPALGGILVAGLALLRRRRGNSAGN